VFLAASFFAVYAINCAVFFWPEHWQQALGAGGLLLLIAVASSVPFVLGGGKRASQVALLVLGVFAVGEAHRLLLRREYRVETRWALPTQKAAEEPHVDTTRDLRVQHYELPVGRAGAAPGRERRVRFVQLTDVHVTERFPFEYYERLSALVQSRNADVVVLTGDLLSKRERLPMLERWLQTLPAARLGRYAVLGNHEYWAHAEDEVRGALARANISVVAGGCRTLPLPEPGPGLCVCGSEAPWGPALSASALREGAGTPFVVLTHTPDNVYDLARLGPLAVLAGHTHGGQLRVPGLGPIIVPSRFGRRFDIGHYRVDGTHLFVSAGAGADSPPVRIFCPADVLELDVTL
jgi:predicted MPP superfamily phosphohydrolase